MEDRVSIAVKALALSAGLLVVSLAAAPAGAAPIQRTASLVSAPTGVPDPDTSFVSFRFASSDGTRALLETTESLTADDTDGGLNDVYLRSGNITTLVSQPLSAGDDTSGVGVRSISLDGTRVILETAQKMTSDDMDSNRRDLYERVGGTTTLVSGPTGVPDPDTGDVNAGPIWVSPDATRVHFATTEKLAADDTDTNRLDLYQHSGGTTQLVSRPASGVTDPDSADASAPNIRPSADGSHVFFETTQKMTADDNDTNRNDVYDRSGGDTTLVSKPAGLADPDSADVTGADAGGPSDGSHVFFETTQKMTPDDNDTNRNDVYERSAGTTSLVSAPTGVADPDTGNATFRNRSTDGSRVFFTTAEKLTSGDLDSNRFDVYERSAGTTKLISAPSGVPEMDSGDMSLAGMTADASHAFMLGTERLTADDGDSVQDVYERSGGTTRLVSKPAAGVPDPGTGTVFFGGNSPDGSRVFFTTTDKMTADDLDTNRRDTFERTAGTTTLAVKPSGVPDPDTGDVNVVGQAANGTRLFFQTIQRMTPDDNDTDRQDIYMGADSLPPQTTITAGPSGTTGDSTPSFSFSSNEGGSTFQCKVDSGSFALCSSPKTVAALADGPHTFQVRARDPGGNLDLSPATRAFDVEAVDATAPDTEITKGPKKKVRTKKRKKKVKFEFSSDDPSASFECSLDDEDFEPCTSPDKEKVKKGRHSFEVRAVDAAGNVDPTPDLLKFRVKRRR